MVGHEEVVAALVLLALSVAVLGIGVMLLGVAIWRLRQPGFMLGAALYETAEVLGEVECEQCVDEAHTKGWHRDLEEN